MDIAYNHEIDYLIKHEYFLEPLCYNGFKLIQIGRAFCQSTSFVDTHIHAMFFELTIINGGEGVITTNGVSTPVKNGDIYISLPCDTHKIESDFNNPLKYDFLAFNADDTVYHDDFEKITEMYCHPKERIIKDEKIKFLVGNAIEEISNNYKYSENILSDIFNQILIYVIRNLSKISASDRLADKTRTELLCFNIMNYIDTHIYTIKNLDEIAKHFGYSYGYLSSLFRKNTSYSISHYYQNKKLDVARILVLENRLKITEIAEMLQYSSLYSFSKAFNNKYGVSPKQYYNKFHGNV